MDKPKYKRILLKISGEALMGERDFGIDIPTLSEITKQIKRAWIGGTEIAIVVGGGNFWRGTDAETWGMDRATGDYAGMLATVINALALQDMLEREDVACRTLSAIPIQTVAEAYIRRRAIRHLERGRTVIFAAGTGNPYMTTDTAAALRAIEIGAEVLLMAKKGIDGVYDTDPNKNPTARKLDRLTHLEALDKHIEVMDATAFSLSSENKLPIIVFDVRAPGGIERSVAGEPIGTLVSSE